MSPVTGRRRRQRWLTPVLALVVGGVIFAAFALGSDVENGVKAFGLMALVAATLAIGGQRNETIAQLSGAQRDERWAAIDLRAFAFSGLVVLLGVLGGWVYEIARGDDGSPYGQLALAGGASYVSALAYLRSRN